MGAKSSCQLKPTLPKSEEEESAHFLNAGTHQISNKSDGNCCYLGQSKSVFSTRRDGKEFGGKNSENAWQKSKQIFREHNQETFNFGFQGNIEGNTGSDDCNRWLMGRDNEEKEEEEGEEGDEDFDLPFQVRRKLALQVSRKMPSQVDKEFPLQASQKLPIQVLNEVPIQFQAGIKGSMQ